MTFARNMMREQIFEQQCPKIELIAFLFACQAANINHIHIYI